MPGRSATGRLSMLGMRRRGARMPEGLSDKQQLILEFLEHFIGEHDYPPSIRDIQNGCNISSTSVVRNFAPGLRR